MAATLSLGIYESKLNWARPGPKGLGFLRWWDQSQYLALAKILASGHLPNAEAYTYGLGLPVLGVPGVWLGMTDPFIIPSLVMTMIAMAALYLAATRIAGRLVAAVSVGCVLLASPLLSIVVVPWSSTVTLCCLSLGLLAVTRPGPATAWRFAALGALAGITFSARYVDVVLIAGLVVAALVLDRSGRRLAHTLAAAIPAAEIAAIVAATHWVAFGSPWRTPYASHMRGQGATATSDQSIQQYHINEIPRHFWGTFITGTDKGVQVAEPLLHRAPWLLLVPLGAVLVFVYRDRWLPLHAVMIPVTAVHSLVYLAFVAGGAVDLNYSNIRYWFTMFPYWSVLAVIAIGAIANWATKPRRRGQPAVEEPATLAAAPTDL
jgi:hypothetical protein